MSRPLPSPTRSVRVRRHVFGRARAGYTTLGCAPSLTVTERRELECFEFGETIEWAGDPKSTEELRFLLRPIAAGIALTRVAPGPPDPSNRPTLLLRSLIFETSDASVIASQLAALLSDPEYFEFEGTEDGPVEIEIERQSPAPVRSDLLEVQQTAAARRGAVLIPLAQTSFSEIAGLVAQVYARTGSLPRVVYRPGSDELDCDVMVIDDHCRRGNASQLRINYPDGRSEAPRPSGKRILGSNFDPRSVVVPREIGSNSNWMDDMNAPKSATPRALVFANVLTLAIVAALLVMQYAPSAPANRSATETRASIGQMSSVIGEVRGRLDKTQEALLRVESQLAALTKAQGEVDAAFATRAEQVSQRIDAVEKALTEFGGRVKTLSEKVGEEVTNSKAFQGSVASLESALTTKLDAYVKEAKSSPSTLKTIDTHVSDLVTTLGTVKGEVMNLKTDLTTQKNSWDKWVKEDWFTFNEFARAKKK